MAERSLIILVQGTRRATDINQGSSRNIFECTVHRSLHRVGYGNQSHVRYLLMSRTGTKGLEVEQLRIMWSDE